MKKIILFLGATYALGLAGCGSNGTGADAETNVLASTDFESLDGWLPADQAATLTREKVHSGKYAIKVDAAHEYSLGFSKPLGQLHDTKPQKIKVSAWVLVPSAEAQAVLVITLGDPTSPTAKPLLWESLALPSVGTPYGTWKEVSKTVTVPAAAGPASRLGIYLWRTGGSQPSYLDDLRVSVEQ